MIGADDDEWILFVIAHAAFEMGPEQTGDGGKYKGNNGELEEDGSPCHQPARAEKAGGAPEEQAGDEGLERRRLIEPGGPGVGFGAAVAGGRVVDLGAGVREVFPYRPVIRSNGKPAAV